MESKSEESHAFKLGALAIIDRFQGFLAKGRDLKYIENAMGEIQGHIYGELEESLHCFEDEVETDGKQG